MDFDKIGKAVDFFENHQYQEAFEMFAEIYNQCSDQSERKRIFQILSEGYYEPNEEELRRNYERNVKLLKMYPYVWEKTFCKFEDLNALLFPISDDYFYCYDREKDCFTAKYKPFSEKHMRYFFEDLDKPVCVTDEDNFYNLTFLDSNVRSSEDFASDNHIYLLYSSMVPLERLMLTCDLRTVLEKQKFVFLIGENRDLYPLDFKLRFGIDYSMMEPHKLRLEEMQRICFWYKRGYSGSSFGVDVLDHNRYIVGIEGVDLFYRSYIKGCRIFQTDLPEKLLKNTSKKYSVKDIELLYHHPDIQWGVSDLGDFIVWLKKSQFCQLTLPELFRAYFIYKYHRDKPDMNPRIVPIILWEPHLNAVDIHNPLILGFPYKIVLNIFRDPIQTLGRIYQREGSIFIPQIMWIGYSMHSELQKNYYSYRFEDLKLHPKETCIALCEVLNIPYDSNMLNSDITEQGIKGEATVRGFDLAPLHRNIDSAYSRFDQIRLQIFYDAILRHYGYPTFDFGECPMDDNDVAFLMKFPFKCEKEYVETGKWEKVTQAEFRQRLFQNMMLVWQLAKQGKLVFPKVIFPKIEDETGKIYGDGK